MGDARGGDREGGRCEPAVIFVVFFLFGNEVEEKKRKKKTISLKRTCNLKEKKIDVEFSLLRVGSVAAGSYRGQREEKQR